MPCFVFPLSCFGFSAADPPLFVAKALAKDPIKFLVSHVIIAELRPQANELEHLSFPSLSQSLLDLKPGGQAWEDIYHRHEPSWGSFIQIKSKAILPCYLLSFLSLALSLLHSLYFLSLSLDILWTNNGPKHLGKIKLTLGGNGYQHLLWPSTMYFHNFSSLTHSHLQVFYWWDLAL